MDAFAPATPAGRRLAEWLRDNQDAVGIDFDAATRMRTRTRTGRRGRPVATDRPLSEPRWSRLQAAVTAVSEADSAGKDVVASNVASFARAVGLDEVEFDLFRFVMQSERDSGFWNLCAGIVGTRRVDSLGLAALALRRPHGELWQSLCRGPLRNLHLVELADDRPGRFALSVPYRISQAMLPPNDGLGDIEQRLIGPSQSTQLCLGDFEHIARERDFIVRLLRGTLAERRSGVNLLFYGPPGTGKTEFCRVIARQLGCDLFAVGEVDEDGNEPLRRERLDALRLADKLATPRNNALLLFDEMEDILEHGDRSTSGPQQVRRAGSKVFFNRLLEQNRVPVLWTANAIDEFDPAFLRRMTFALEMKALSTKGRARLWEGLAQRQGLTLPAGQASALAQRYNVAPSLMTGAVQAVATARGNTDEIDFVVTTLAKPVCGARVRQASAAAHYSAELINADSDLAALETAVARQNAARDFSLCLYGPPGTGKSAFARHLAAAMGLDPLVKRGSDLLSKYIGETEQRIAAAFAEARMDARFLIIDEAEGFLWQRGGASRSWEVSMVNELLVAMESHPLPFACTTNHLEFIDPAALRRFSFKVKFGFLTPAQTALAWRRYFATEPPKALCELIALTPGDFAAVARKLRVLGATAGGPETLRLLEQEVAVKNLPGRRIGF
jgi:ATP-dependent 26S proteasome regulatory subunit